MWAEPDEGSYNYKLADIGSVFDKTPARLSEELINRVIMRASPYYPIMIVSGSSIDGLLDCISLGERKWDVRKSFGTFPRKISGEERSNSIEEFKEHFRGSEAVQRMVTEDIVKVKEKLAGIERAIKFHKKGLKEEVEKSKKVSEELSNLRKKWKKEL